MVFILLALFALALRIVPILGGNFPFMFDGAKDSLVMLEMYLQHKPALVGPTTSISGLFYGPAWYYIALPFNILGGFHPLASVVGVLFLSLITLYVFYRYVGRFSAFLYAVSISVIASQQTAWTPYMTSFCTLPVFLLLKKLKSGKYANTWVLMGIAFFSSLMFHFEVAFAIVFLPLVIVLLFLSKMKMQLKQFVLMCVAFFITLAPSAMFELRHDFLQTRAVMNFVTRYREQSAIIQPNSDGPARIVEVARNFYDNIHLSTLPLANMALSVASVLLVLFFLYKNRKVYEYRVLLLILAGTFLLYLDLPIKPYYLVALTPLWIYLFSKAVESVIPKYKPHIVIAFLILSVGSMYGSWQNYRSLAQTDRILLAPKLKAIETAYAMSDGKPFSSYQFVPEIYDYTYQLLYLTENLKGKPLPTEFSYAPGEITYIPQKHVPANTQKPEFIILIVEKFDHKQFFDPWWDRVAKHLTILETVKINDAITVYKTKQVAK